MELKNKIVVITGGTSGLGLELAKAFLTKRAQVIVCAPEIPKTAEGLNFIKCDVTNESEMKNFVDDVEKKFGKIDVWINNAGVWIPHGPMENIDTEKVRVMFDVNFFGVFLGSKYATLSMKKRGEGLIVNIASTSALSGRPTSSAYCASKFAVDGFSKSIKLELESSGIKVQTIFPGGMKTHLFDEQIPTDFEGYMDPSDVAKKIVSNIESNNPESELIIKRSQN